MNLTLFTSDALYTLEALLCEDIIPGLHLKRLAFGARDAQLLFEGCCSWHDAVIAELIRRHC